MKTKNMNAPVLTFLIRRSMALFITSHEKVIVNNAVIQQKIKPRYLL